MKIIFIIYVYSLGKNQKDGNQNPELLPYLTRKSSKGINFYTINIQTNSNLITLKESSFLPYFSNDIIKKIQVEESRGLELKTCQLCGAVSDIKESYCYYCGSKLGYRKKRRI